MVSGHFMLPHFPLSILTATPALVYACNDNKCFDLNSVLGLILKDSTIMLLTVSILRALLRREHPTKGKLTIVLAQTTSAHCYEELYSIARPYWPLINQALLTRRFQS
jgi:hypothetical protein